MYGLCKYGPTCKFDHPVLGYSYNYSVSLPALSVLDPSTFPYHQKSSPTAHLSEISPSKSSKFTEWNNRKRGGAASKTNQKIEAKMPKDSPEQASSPKDSLAASSEHPNDQSEWTFILFFDLFESFCFFVTVLIWNGVFMTLCLLSPIHLWIVWGGIGCLEINVEREKRGRELGVVEGRLFVVNKMQVKLFLH